MFKKIMIVFILLLVVVIGAAVVLPVVFKDDLVALVKTQANENVNARIDFGEFDLSLLKSFPDFTLSIHDVVIENEGDFEGVTLARIGVLEISLDLMSVINGGTIAINKIGVERPTIHVIVLPDGRANYDIAMASEEEAVEEPTANGEFSLSLKNYYFKEANIIYDDRSSGMFTELKDFNHRGKGDFTQDIFELETHSDAQELTYKQDGLAYLNRVGLNMDFDIGMDLPKMRFTFSDNYVGLNALQLSFDGFVEMPQEEGDPIDMNLTFSTKETSFKGLLSLVPAVFMQDLDGVETEGNVALSGMAKGRMVGDLLPQFSLLLKVNDARFHYPDLPKSAENIHIDLAINNPGGSEDNTVVDLDRFHVEIADNPVDMTLHMRTPMSDPYIETSISMNLDLATLKDVVPLEDGQDVNGIIFSDLMLKGNQSAIDQERYEDFDASGSLVLTNLDYKDPEMPYQTVIKTCSLNFSPAYAELTAFFMTIGESDLSMTGRVDNIVAWYVADEPLSGKFNLSSDKLDLDQLAGEEVAAEEETEEAMSVLEVPSGFDFELNTSITSLLYDGMKISNLRGEMTLRDQTISMRNVAMNLMQGSLTMNGTYATINPLEPQVDFALDIIGWDVGETYTYLDMAQKMAPVMEKANGKFSTGLKMKGALDQHMELKYNTLTGGGSLLTRAVTLNSPLVLERIAEAIKYNGVKDMTLDDVRVKYQFEDGRVNVDPCKFVLGKEVPSVFSGSHGFDMTLNYLLNLDIPSKLMGSSATQIVSGLFSKANQALGTNATIPERVKVDVDITGTSEDPKINARLAGTSGAADPVDDLKAKAKDELLKQKAELEAKAKDELNKAKSEAEAKARAEADAAKRKAEAQATEAKRKAEAEAAAAKKKLEEEKKKAEAEAKRKADEAKRKAEEEAKKKLDKLFK
ncbi:MAG: AsmA-like C-terminal region-containing protein [Cryomorphaceae bacterium]